MAAQAAHVVDKVLPSVPLRQWVVSFPYEMRLLLAKNPDVLSAVLRLVMRVVVGRYTNRRTEPPQPGEQELRVELLGEMQHPKNEGEPDILIEGDAKAGVHLFVIWAKWLGLEQAVRSRNILDAYAEWKDEREALQVTVSMGLTPDEAKSQGLEAAG